MMSSDEKLRAEAFNSEKKRSATIVHNKNGGIMLYCKGASEWVISDCTQYTDAIGNPQSMSAKKKADHQEY